MIKPPAIRFMRVYDVNAHRMLNIWERLTTQRQIDDAPRAIELMVQCQTIEEARKEIKRIWSCDPEALAQILEASQKLVEAQDSVYEARA